MKLGYNELSYRKHGYNVLQKTTNILVPIDIFTTKINRVIMSPGYNERIWLDPSCYLQLIT